MYRYIQSSLGRDKKKNSPLNIMIKIKKIETQAGDGQWNCCMVIKKKYELKA